MMTNQGEEKPSEECMLDIDLLAKNSPAFLLLKVCILLPTALLQTEKFSEIS